jgi:ABC-type enterochelin transport system permease subunit
MPLDRFVLILVVALAAAAATVLVAALGMSAVETPDLGLGVAALLALVAYVLVRVISGRMRSADEACNDHGET